MTEHRAILRVRFYPARGEWTCVVQRMGSDGMPAADVVSGTGPSKGDAWNRALAAAGDDDVRQALRAHDPH
jgi:hypothetical protein